MNRLYKILTEQGEKFYFDQEIKELIVVFHGNKLIDTAKI